MPVSVRRMGAFAIVTIDNPPVNALSRAVRAGLEAAVAEVTGMGVPAAILTCAGATFVAGADVAEFDLAPLEPHLPEVLDAIESSPVPWVAGMHGTVLGGGFELGMACAWRLAAPGTRLGLPEVRLGLIPGAGGTQRLPRLIGLERAARLAATGEMVSAEVMFSWGGLDAVPAGEALPAALAFLTPLPPRPVAVSARGVVAEDLTALRSEVRSRARGEIAPEKALEAVGWAASLPFAEGQTRSRAMFLELRDSPQARALRHAFFAERAVMRPKVIEASAPREITRVAVVGGGLMGAGIAAACLGAGLAVALIERDAAAAAAGAARVAGLLDGAVTRGKLTAEAMAAQLGRLEATADYGAAAGADLAVEAVFEDLAVKRAVFARLAAAMGAEAILATNTSYLDPAAIGEGIANPKRLVGLHFFSPVPAMRLVEVVATPATGAEVIATAFALARRLGKVGVLAGVCDGFIGNRILTAYRREADYLLADGCLPHEVDAAMRGFGMPMGPYELQDLTGLQIAWAYRQRQAESRSPAERYVTIADRLVEAGRLGQGRGGGWYRYAEGGRAPERDPEVEALVRSEAKGREGFGAAEIVARLMAVMVNEGARIVEEGVAEGPDAVDVVKLLGYGFPRWRGGPMYWARTEGIEQVRAAMARVVAQSPGAWRVSRMLGGAG